tara:strand:+ start:329 stop:712 length:384 start_codon:yes stop_codon:yes gene_type:complete
MRNKITEGLDNLVSRIQQYRDEIEQVEKDNNKLNEDLQALEKERDEGYKSFNTDTHILIERDVLTSIRDDLQEAKTSANYAVDEANSAESCAEEAKGSAEIAEDNCRYAMDKIDETIEQADKGDNNE